MLKKIKALIAQRVLDTMEKEIAKRIAAMPVPVSTPAGEPAAVITVASKATVSNPAYVCGRFWSAIKAAGLTNRHHLPALTVQQVNGMANCYNIGISVPPKSGDLSDSFIEYHNSFMFQGTADVDICAQVAVAQLECKVNGGVLH